MTDSDDNDMRPFGAADAADVAQQRTVPESGGGIVESKDIAPLSSIDIAERSQEFYDVKLNREAVYRDRLARFWSFAHANSSSAENTAEREVFLRTMIDVSEDLAVLIPDQEAVSPPTGMILGSIQEVELEVAERLSTAAVQEDLVRFMHWSIAPTIARLEGAREGTPELRVDIVARVLFSLRGSPAAADLGCDLYRYLQSQEEREAGFYLTVVNLAVIVSSGGPDYISKAIFLYHSALDGLRALEESGKLSLGEERSNEAARQLVSKAAANMALIIVRRVREMSPDDRVRAVASLRDLKTISAVTAPVPSFVEAAPQVVVAALGLSTGHPDQLLASILDLAPIPEAWELGYIATSWLEAAGGVVAAASGGIENAVDLFFNAGISLRGQSSEINGRDAGLLLRARMLVNLVGLRLSLKSTQAENDLYVSFVGLDGIDCAVNFVSSFVEYRALGDRVMDMTSSAEALARELVHLAKWPPLRETERRLDRGRLDRSATALGVTVEERSSFPELIPMVDHTVEVLRASFRLAAARTDDLIVDTADVVGALYGSVLTEDRVRLERQLDELVAAREDALQMLVERYRPYSSATRGGVGTGPAVPAGVITEAEWRSAALRLTDPVASVVRAIAEFPY